MNNSSFQSLVLPASFHRNPECYRENTGLDFSTGPTTLLGTAVSESRRVCERQKKRMTQHLAGDSTERKTTNKSRQTGNRRGCGRLSES